MCDGGDDDMEWEWTSEQISLLGKVRISFNLRLLDVFAVVDASSSDFLDFDFPTELHVCVTHTT